MDTNSSDHARPELSLVPLQTTTIAPPESPAQEASTVVAPEAGAVATSVDIFLARATRQFAQGHIDQPLWVRALAQAGGDEALAKAGYLRARAAAMRVAEREKRARRSARHTGAAPDAQPAASPSPAATAPRSTGPSDAVPWRKYLPVVGVIATGAVVGLWWLLTPGASPSMPSSTMAAAPASARSATGRSPGKTPATAAEANGPAAQQELNEHFATRVQELRHAGNWNVLVLYASDWTRKQPENGTAWKELSIGYANMRQFDDAYEAAKKAVQLTPGDPGAWRNLGLIDVELEQPVAALEAFEKATLLNDQDLPSLVQVGVLNAQLGRLPAAQAAFGRVLAANPENVDALCGEASIARKEGRVKDAEALARQLKSVDGTCRDANEGNGTTVAHGTATSSVKAPAPVSTAASRRPIR